MPKTLSVPIKDIPIRYVGLKDVEHDVTYGTGDWKSGETRDIALAAAKHLLMHPDVWEDARDADAQKRRPIKPEPLVKPIRTLDENQETREAAVNVALLSGEALSRYALVHYHKRIEGTDAEMRNEVRHLMANDYTVHPY